MKHWLILLIIPVTFVVFQFFLAFSSAAANRQHTIASNLFALLTWGLFILVIYLIFHFFHEQPIWLKILIVLGEYMMGRCLYNAINVWFINTEGRE